MKQVAQRLVLFLVQFDRECKLELIDEECGDFRMA